MAKPKKYVCYVVWEGRQRGIFATWDECAAQIDRYPGGRFKGFETRREAEAAYAMGYDAYVKSMPRRPGSTTRAAAPSAMLPTVGYAVDAACSGSPGPVEYRGVHLPSGVEVFRQGPYARGTNNIGEFLAIVHMLARLKSQSSTVPVYSDSRIAIGWVKIRTCRTKLVRDRDNAELFDLIARAETWLANNDYPNVLLKWDTEAWGENPADFGRK